MANTYLTKTLGTPTNNKIWTFSAWVKRAKVADGQYPNIFCANSLRDCIRFHDSDKIQIFFNEVSSGNLFTNRLFRDVNAWYHIVVAVDTTQATASNRVKLYVNGVQETSFATETYPAQNYTNFINSAIEHRIGKDISYSEYYKGSMSHIHFIDGTAYDASAFGETDSTTGEWKIKTSPSVSYGTNGFFILKDGNSVTDQSPNTNNFTVAGGTLTKTEDCPSNVFATWNPLNRGNAQFTYTNGNNTITVGGNTWTSTMGTLGFSTGKFYWEITDLESECQMGVCDAGINIASSTAQNLTGVTTFYNQSGGEMRKDGSETTANYGLFNSTDVIGIAVDMDNKLISIYKNGSAHVTNYALSTSMTTAMPFHSGYYANNLIKTNFGNGYFGTTAVSSAGTNASNIGIFEYDVPTGYTALSTKGLNE
jgi:hypothetical protein